MRCLTLRPIYAWAVFCAGKDIENRGWRPPADLVGERFAIHAGARKPKGDTGESFEAVARIIGEAAMPETIAYGGIIGTVLLRCVSETSHSRWYVPNRVAWHLAEPQRLAEPVPCRGQQGLWNLTPEQLEAMERIADQLRELAAKVERQGTLRVNNREPHRIAQDVVHILSWGLAHLNVDGLVSDALDLTATMGPRGDTITHGVQPDA